MTHFVNLSKDPVTLIFDQSGFPGFVVLAVTNSIVSPSAALCGGFEKYDILEDVGFSARNRRKLSQGTDPRPNLDTLLRRQSTESTVSTDSQEEERLISISSEPELRQSTSLSSGCKNTLTDNTKNVISPQNTMDLDMSVFDFTELRSDRLSSTEI